MLKLVKKIAKQKQLSTPQKLFTYLIIVFIIILPLTILWLSLYNLAQSKLLVGIILLLLAIGIIIEAIASLISIDDLLEELDKFQGKEKEE